MIRERWNASSPDLAELTDEACVRRVQDRSPGDPQALRAREELVRRYAPAIHNLLVRVLGDRELAADGSQEVFLRVQRHLGRFDPERTFRPWIFSIAWNHVRDHWRRRGRRGETFSLEATRDGLPERGLPDPAAREPSEVIEGRERARLVREALGRLGPTQRAILVLREYEGLSYEEIAGLAGVKVGTVKSRLNRARIELKDRLRALSPDHFGEGGRRPGPPGEPS